MKILIKQLKQKKKYRGQVYTRAINYKNSKKHA